MASHHHGHHDHHGHGQSHGHGHTHDLTEQNRAFFNDFAVEYDEKPAFKKAAQQATDFIRQSLPFVAIPAATNHETKLLDYACGTGMISRALGPSVTSIRALDLSSSMVARYNALAKESDIPSVRAATAVEGNLLADHNDNDEGGASSSALSLSGPEWHSFDIACVGLALHHFPDPARAIERLVERLRVGGVLLVVEFLDDGGWMDTKAEGTVHKHGFGEGELRGLMEGAGCGGFGWRVMEEKVRMGVEEGKMVEMTLVLARGVKVAS